MSLYSQFGTDKTVEKEGVFLQYGTTKDGKPIQIKICRAGGANTAYNRAMEAKTKPYRRQLQNGTLDMEVMNCAKCTLILWLSVGQILRTLTVNLCPSTVITSSNCLRTCQNCLQTFKNRRLTLHCSASKLTSKTQKTKRRPALPVGAGRD